ncbi:MAG: hypothetical protein ACFFDK_17890 [Promethearchaeota archaeon]
MSFKWKNDSIKRNFGFYIEQLNFKENRFHAIYFVDSLTGALLLSKRYSSGNNYGLTETDDDLISNFLNAINMFIREIRTNKEEEIQEINFKDTRILYEKKGRLLCVGITKKTNVNVERAILHELLKDFYYRFEDIIQYFKGYVPPEIINYKNRLESIDLNSLFKFDINLEKKI